MKIVVAFTKDEDVRSGGAKQLYRHVDVLRAAGFDACIAHPTRGFRHSWFSNSTRVECSEDLELGPDDFLVFGEAVEHLPVIRGADRCGKVVLVQNPYNVFSGFGRDIGRIREMYGTAAAVLCQSRYTEKSVRHFFPSARVMGYRYSFDRLPFSYCKDKRRQIAYMPQKSCGMADWVMNLMSLRKWPDGWVPVRLDGANESQVAEVMKSSMVFAAYGMNEGFGMPAAEAMACGCAVVGWPGYAGEEFMLPGLCWPVADRDVLRMAWQIEEVVQKDWSELLAIGKKASEFVISEYSSEKESVAIGSAWKSITKSSVDLPSDVQGRMRREVAAYVPVYNEGPYLDHLLKWLVKRVGSVFVMESEKPWNPTAEPGGKSSDVVGKVLREMPEARGILRYYLSKDSESGPEPLGREAAQRNRDMEEIRKCGFEHVWMVEADEFYTDTEADALWRWYFERCEVSRVVRCQWHTYWRSMKWRIDKPEGFHPNIIFHSDCKFVSGRKMSETDEAAAAEVPTSVCMPRHYSWARTPSDVRRKLSAWGHANQLRRGWLEEVFLPWRPGCKMTNLHPTVPEVYHEAVRCGLPMPEALKGHPFENLELIDEPEQSKFKIKVVVMSHNQPESVDRLYESLAPVFDDVEVFDSGSEPGKVPKSVTRAFPNIYWTGMWNEVVRTCQGYDAVWVLGGDLELKSSPEEFRVAIERDLPFGCWSPAVEGRSKPFMKPDGYKGRSLSVKNIEGMALAVSGELLKRMGELPTGSVIGYGQDLWMCMKARQAGMENVIDGGVLVRHPEGRGYDDIEALRQMEETFSSLYGKNYRQDAFEFSDFFEDNLESDSKKEKVMEGRFKVVTVDNGWGMEDFVRIGSQVKGAKLVAMRKGVTANVPQEGVESIPYEGSLEALLKDADAALFTKVGDANKEEYEKILKSGIPMVVHDAYAKGMIDHMNDGFVYLHDSWAIRWLSELRDSKDMREAVKKARQARTVTFPKERVPMMSVEEVAKVCPSCADKMKAMNLSAVKPEMVKPMVPKVTVITPTYRRDPEIVRRCIDCMKLQTLPLWEQLVCSDGEEEPVIRKMVEELKDPRVTYQFTTGKKQGDFGNTVRAEMLKKARGEFVLFFDDDNLILPEYLSKMVTAIVKEEAHGVKFSVCKIMHFGPLNEPVSGKPPKVLEGRPMKLYHVDPLQVLVRRDAMLEIGWDTVVGYLSDGVTLEKLGEKYQGVWMKEILGIHM